jgi:hypothetical protein
VKRTALLREEVDRPVSDPTEIDREIRRAVKPLHGPLAFRLILQPSMAVIGGKKLRFPAQGEWAAKE